MSWLTSGSTRAEVALIFRTLWRGRVVGAGATFAAFGIAMFSSPTAHADDFGLGGLIGDLIASASSAEVGTQAIDQALAASASGAETVSAAGLFQQYIYDPLHAGVESWINSSFGEQVDHLLNTASGQFLIGNGADGTGQLDPNGGDGGLWFGDGGNGWDSDEAGFAGGSGGDAVGFFGTGGDGGLGGAGAAGGDGGDAGSLFGIGGDGGNAGAGATAAGLPALGGAGGNAGMFGEHGMVGDYGTLPGGLTPTAEPRGSLLSLGTSGGWLTNSDGQVVMLHGLNEVYKVAPGDPLSSGFSDDDAAFLAENGFNAVRVGVIWSDLEPEPGVFDTDYLNSIESTVQTLGNHGIYSIIDFHQDAYSTAFGGEGAPDWAVQTDGVRQPHAALPVQRVLQSRRAAGLGVILVERRRLQRHWSGEQLQPDAGVRSPCLQRQPQRGRIRAHERAIAGHIVVPADPVGQPVLRQSAADPVLRPGCRCDPGGRSDHADFLRTQRAVQRGPAHRSGPRGRHEHRVVVPRLLRIRPRPAGVHTGRQRDRRQRRELRAGARNSGIHDRVRRDQRPSGDPGARCRAPTST